MIATTGHHVICRFACDCCISSKDNQKREPRNNFRFHDRPQDQHHTTSGAWGLSVLLPIAGAPNLAGMGVRDRIPRIRARMLAEQANAATRARAVNLIEQWNAELSAGRTGTGATVPLWSPSIRCAIVAGCPWLHVYCPGCETSRAIDVRTIDRHPEASVAGLVLGLRCSWCRGGAPMPRLLGLHALPARD